MTPIGILLTLEGDRVVESGMRRVSGSVNLLDSAVGTLTNRLGGLTGAFAGALSVREYLQSADAVTQLQNRLQLVSGTVGSATIAYEALYGVSQRARVSFTELGGTYASIAAATANLGISQGRLLTVTEAIANAVTISGSSAQASQAALIQLGQGLSSGTLRGEELNSVIEQTPRLAQALADGLGVTRGELKKMGEQGAITAEAVIKALESQASVLSGEVKNANLTVGQAMTVLGGAAVKTVGELDKATGASSAAAAAIVSIGRGIETVGQFAKSHEGVITTTIGVLAGAGTTAGLLAVANAITGAGGIVAAITAVRVAVAGLGAVLAANPIGLALLGLGAVTGAVIANSGAPKTVAGLAQEIEHTSERIAKAEAQLAAAGGSRGELTRKLEERIAAMRKYREEMQQQWGSKVGGAVDTSAEDARLARQTAQNKADTQDAAALIAIRQELYGVDKDYLPTLMKLNAQYEQRKISEQEYVELVGKLAKKNYKEDKSGAADASKRLKADARTDLSDLQQDYRETAAVLANGERLLDAQRQANQISDSDYYAAKRTYITTLAEAEALMLEQQNAVLRAQKLTGAERIDADRKIAENSSKVTQLRTKASTDVALSVMNETAAVKRLADAYADAREAAEQQLRASADRYNRELAGMGQGGNWRDQNSAANQINDKYQADRERLAGELRRNDITRSVYEQQLQLTNETNQAALALDKDYWRRRTELQADWTVGASEALNSYLDSCRNVASATEAAFSRAFSGAEDAIVQFAMTGKLSIKDLAQSAIADLIRIQIRAAMLNAMGGSGGNLIGSLFGAGVSLLTGSTPVGAAGNAGYGDYSASGLAAAYGGARAGGGGVEAGKFYDVAEKEPELLRIGNRTLLMMGAQSGTVVPPAAASMGGGADVSGGGFSGIKGIQIINNTGEPGRVESAQINGEGMLQIVIARAAAAAVSTVAGQLANREGEVYRGLRAAQGA